MAAFLIAAAFVGLVALRQVSPADDPYAMEAVTAPPVEPGVVKAGMPAPGLTLTSLGGELVSLSDYTGRPVLINFWASWCPPCREEFPLLAQARDDYAVDGLEVLGITHNDAPEFARAFAAEIGADWPMLVDPDDAAWDAYDAVGLPTSFFVDAEGLIGHVQIGPVDKRQLADALATIGLRTPVSDGRSAP